MNTIESENKVNAFTHRKIKMQRKTIDHTMQHTKPAQDVFALLCPTRECDWLKGWDCDLIYTQSGYATLDTVFVSPFCSPDGDEVWMCTRFQKDEAVEYVRMGKAMVVKLTITLDDHGDGTSTSRWTELYTALTSTGNCFLDNIDGAVEYRELEKMLNHYLETGEMV